MTNNNIDINIYNCIECGVNVSIHKENVKCIWDEICKKCYIVNALNDALEHIATDDNESNLNIKLCNFLLTIDKGGLNEILGNNLDKDLTELWEILNKFNPSGNFLTNELDNNLAFTYDEWDQICTEMAFITDDLK